MAINQWVWTHFSNRKPLKLLQNLRRQVKMKCFITHHAKTIPCEWCCGSSRTRTCGDFHLSIQFHGRKTFATFPLRVASIETAATYAKIKAKSFTIYRNEGHQYAINSGWLILMCVCARCERVRIHTRSRRNRQIDTNRQQFNWQFSAPRMCAFRRWIHCARPITVIVIKEVAAWHQLNARSLMVMTFNYKAFPFMRCAARERARTLSAISK